MKKSVVIIEDEPFIIEALTFLLENEGLVVRSISDGANAIDFIIKSKPNLVILDIMLPNVSGMKILEDIRSMDEISNLPVLMLTAKGQKKDRRAAEEAGVSKFMTKPFDNQELIENVKAMIRS
ncbi:MAG: response regulator transcription factor [Amylibacter sp.]|nr:response regulator [Amylibacter sp.]MDB2611047.1 response regulator [Amylibacter sp.]MDC0489207.1 response regulator [Amylibacter sp.]MDC0983240.1 response regulator [Amylibacter sp.]